MAAVSPARANALLLGVMVFALLLLLSASVRSGIASNAVAGAAGTASQPAVAAERSLSAIAVSVLHFFRDLHSDRTEAQALRLQVDELKLREARAGELVRENERLRLLLGMRTDLVPDATGASVLTASLATQSQSIVVDRGKDAGIREDMAVVAWGGAVGRVVSVERDFARVRLLTDPNSGVAGVVERTRAEGMLVGRGFEPMDMLYVPKFADVAVGDRVVTSGLDGVFPRGLGIGRVSLVGEPVGASKAIRVEPEIDFRALEDVLILKSPKGTPLLAPEAVDGAR